MLTCIPITSQSSLNSRLVPCSSVCIDLGVCSSPHFLQFKSKSIFCKSKFNKFNNIHIKLLRFMMRLLAGISRFFSCTDPSASTGGHHQILLTALIRVHSSSCTSPSASIGGHYQILLSATAGVTCLLHQFYCSQSYYRPL